MTSTACSFDQSGQPVKDPAAADAAVAASDASQIAGPPDGGVVDANGSAPDACKGTKCDD